MKSEVFHFNFTEKKFIIKKIINNYNKLNKKVNKRLTLILKRLTLG